MYRKPLAIIVGDGAIAQALSYKLALSANVYLATSSLFTGVHRDHQIYDIPDFSSYWLDGIKPIRSIYQLDQLIRTNTSTIVFCIGSLTLVQKLSRSINRFGTYPIFFLTSHWSSLKYFLDELGDFIIPVYPLVATEFWIDKIVTIGEFDLEIPIECSNSFLNTAQYELLIKLPLKTIIIPMESRFSARFYVTSFLYWTLLEANVDSKFYENKSLISLQLQYWIFVNSFTSQFADMSNYTLSALLGYSEFLYLSSPTDSDLSWLYHILINHKRRKMTKFVDRLKYMV